MECEASGNLKTCEAIIKVVLPMGIDEEDQFRTYLDEAESCESK